jgi:hypothetical protein
MTFSKPAQLRYQIFDASSQTTFPEYANNPSAFLKVGTIFFVTLNVATEFGIPKLNVTRGTTTAFCAVMPVPETSMNEHGHSISAQY